DPAQAGRGGFGDRGAGSRTRSIGTSSLPLHSGSVPPEEYAGTTARLPFWECSRGSEILSGPAGVPGLGDAARRAGPSRRGGGPVALDRECGSPCRRPANAERIPARVGPARAASRTLLL